MIYPCQIRAARALIGMSQQELAERSLVGLATIKRIEAVGSEITGTAKTLVKIQKALEAAGIRFIDETDGAGPGLRLMRPL
ncbi:MAG: helix-turn-helix transcriptional regulator [Hyphomicrobium sp.]|jgi:transcriptional regulator with XRE-family HTH domain|nr:helix-turn-helix transcriptional regulator [Hyphomicrobium sp.]